MTHGALTQSDYLL